MKCVRPDLHDFMNALLWRQGILQMLQPGMVTSTSIL